MTEFAFSDRYYSTMTIPLSHARLIIHRTIGVDELRFWDDHSLSLTATASMDVTCKQTLCACTLRINMQLNLWTYIIEVPAIGYD